MSLLRLAVVGAAGYGVYRWLSQPRAVASGNRTYGGLAAIFDTREQADLAVEHLVQEHGVDRYLIFVEPVGSDNTAGTNISGGDAPSGDDGARARHDGALNGSLRLSVSVKPRKIDKIKRALSECGAHRITQL
jgi:hypothetical protein